MKIKRIKFQNYTVFEDQQMEFSPGINVIIGENGTGKTHLMKGHTYDLARLLVDMNETEKYSDSSYMFTSDSNRHLL